MKRKKSPNKDPQPSPQAVMAGDCFATFVKEATSIGNEVVARREYGADVGEYLKQKGLLEDFGAWRAAKHASRS